MNTIPIYVLGQIQASQTGGSQTGGQPFCDTSPDEVISYSLLKVSVFCKIVLITRTHLLVLLLFPTFVAGFLELFKGVVEVLGPKIEKLFAITNGA